MSNDNPILVEAHPTVFRRADLDAFEREILCNPAATEHDASRFFAKFPKFLLLGQGDEVRREVVLIDTSSGTRQRVDFFRRLYGQAFWDIVDSFTRWTTGNTLESTTSIAYSTLSRRLRPTHESP